MDISDSERIKQRVIVFQEIHPNPNQAETAALFLVEVDGILNAAPVSPVVLHVHYDVIKTTLHEIEEALTELGLHLDTGLFNRLKRALHYYTEETVRANCGCDCCDVNCTDKLFAKRYELMEHGCRDERPEHWRRYL
ncbi:hypothetical protein G3480_17670 [Thiorhodococcus mannitoliphagus]|uniref:Uncharacterized protein n=1 Tax=Thiorhodococcus mannitoliphagus TaxID=329406 RepID=A0A6P1DYL6_9GAMM|nr:hypothetical protein [Thiorhodococcus mannitoliphagus]NEX22111.1 hypothetical protein [Thiorhodococcus mannitoliphagus]